MEVKVVNFSNPGQSTKLTLNKEIFGIKPHKQAVHDVIVSQQASLRQGTHKVKDRSEVAGGGRKPWKQKGTGRARQGSIRAPQWYKGGVVFGPSPNANYRRKVNRKVYRLGLKSIWSQKLQDKELMVINKFSFTDFSTKKAVELLHNLKLETEKLLIIIDELTPKIRKSFANLERVKILVPAEVSPLELIDNTKILITKAALQNIEKGLQ